MSRTITLTDLHTARAVVGGAMPPTPQYAWPLLCERLGAEVWVKHENHTPTGAFKVRGGLTYLEAMRRNRPHVRGLVTATRGNHGQSIAFAAGRHGVPVTIYVPHGNSAEKNAAMRGFGATLVEHGQDFQAAREAAYAHAAASGWEMVPSYHRDLVLGVATYAYELLHAVPNLDTLYVPIGQGSGIAACVIVRDLLGCATKIVGVQSVGAPAFALSFAAGEVVATETAFSLADGMATRAPDAEPVAIIAAGVERIVLVSDDAIAQAIRAFWTDTHNLSEGAGAAGLAAAMQEREANLGKRVGVVLCGGNIDLALFRSWVSGDRGTTDPVRY